MKTAVLFLFLFNYYCAAQQQKDLMALPLVPSTTDCPKWKKNKNKTNMNESKTNFDESRM